MIAQALLGSAVIRVSNDSCHLVPLTSVALCKRVSGQCVSIASSPQALVLPPVLGGVPGYPLSLTATLILCELLLGKFALIPFLESCFSGFYLPAPSLTFVARTLPAVTSFEVRPILCCFPKPSPHHWKKNSFIAAQHKCTMMDLGSNPSNSNPEILTTTLSSSSQDASDITSP